MKKSSSILMALCGSSVLLGCASNASNSAFGSTAPISSTLQAFIDTAQSLYNRGRELHKASRLTEADQYYQQALKIDPSNMDAQNALAAIDASRGDIDRAIRLLESLAEAHPDAAHVYANLGYAYYLKGQYALAQETLERATMLDPSNENSWKKLNKVNTEIYRKEMLAHKDAANKQIVLAGEGVEINQITPGVYALRYPDTEEQPLQAMQTQSTHMQLTQPAQVAKLNVLVSPAVAEHPAASMPVATSMPVASSTSRVELVNGNGVTGLARTLRGLIAEQQWKVVRTRNNEQYTVKATRIEYAYSYYPAARQLAETMGVSAVLRPNNQQEGSNLRVVLGRDYTSVEPMRQRVAGLPFANVN